MSGHLFFSFNPNSSFKDILKYWGPYVVHFKHRDSAYVVHIISRDSTYQGGIIFFTSWEDYFQPPKLRPR